MCLCAFFRKEAVIRGTLEFSDKLGDHEGKSFHRLFGALRYRFPQFRYDTHIGNKGVHIQGKLRSQNLSFSVKR